jgi:hypothetical protein
MNLRIAIAKSSTKLLDGAETLNCKVTAIAAIKVYLEKIERG